MKHRLFFAAAAVCAFVAAAAAVTLVGSYLKTTAVLVAARDLDANTVISEKDVRLETVSARIAGDGVLRDVYSATGKALDRPLPAGTPIASDYLKPPSSSGTAGRLTVYPGTVAVPLPSKLETTVGGTIKAGDRVTVYALYKSGAPAQQGKGTPPGTVEELAVNVAVLDVPSGGAPVGGKGASGVVLSVTPEQAARILASQAAGADITCVLLPVKKGEE